MSPVSILTGTKWSRRRLSVASDLGRHGRSGDDECRAALEFEQSTPKAAVSQRTDWALQKNRVDHLVESTVFVDYLPPLGCVFRLRS
jgi:hypothetical protein